MCFFTESPIILADDPELMNLMVIAGFESVDNAWTRTNIVPAMGIDHLVDGYRTILKQI